MQILPFFATIAIVGSAALPRPALAPVPSQDSTHAAPDVATTLSPATPTSGSDAQMRVPFAVGEKADYDVKFGVVKVGNASMTVAGIETIRGRSAWHTIFRLSGGTFVYKVDDVFESWFDRENMYSLRFHQQLEEGSRERNKQYEIYPEKKTYMEMDKDPPREHASVADPLDDGSFLYFIRTLNLEVGKTYEFNRYFRPDRNPVRIRVARKEKIKVPAGTFECIVVQPVIKTSGIFSDKGKAEVWLSNDDRKIVVQLKSSLSFGSINLYLKSYTAGK